MKKFNDFCMMVFWIGLLCGFLWFIWYGVLGIKVPVVSGQEQHSVYLPLVHVVNDDAAYNPYDPSGVTDFEAYPPHCTLRIHHDDPEGVVVLDATDDYGLIASGGAFGYEEAYWAADYWQWVILEGENIPFYLMTELEKLGRCEAQH